MISKSSEAQGRGEKRWRMTECWISFLIWLLTSKKYPPKTCYCRKNSPRSKDGCVSANAFIQAKTLNLVWSVQPLIMKLTSASCNYVNICLCVSNESFSLANTFWHSAGSHSELEDAGQEAAGGHVSDFTCAGWEALCRWVVHWEGLCLIRLYHYKVIHLD